MARTMFDCHVHSLFSSDGKSSMQELCSAALSRGLRGLTFTDHIDTEKAELLNNPNKRREYIRTINELKEKYDSAFCILSGYELSAPHKKPIAYADLYDADYDCKMISIHHGDMSISLYEKEKYIYSYLQEVEKAVCSGNYDVLGHIDLLRRIYGKFEYDQDQLERIYQFMIHKGMALEVNTHSFKKVEHIQCEDFNYVKLWKSCGGKHIVIGSDAHTCDKLGDRFEGIMDFLPTGLEVGHYKEGIFIIDEELP